jgi:transposase
MLGAEACGEIKFICSDMWRPYLRVIRERCPKALNILDRFHIVAKMNKALDEVRAGEARRIAAEGGQPVLKRSRWCLLKRRGNLTDQQQGRLRELMRCNLRTVRASAGWACLAEMQVLAKTKRSVDDLLTPARR